MKFGRYELRGEVAYGIVEGEVISRITAPPFGAYETTGERHALSEVKLLAPCAPAVILAMALNYRSHLGSGDAPTQPEPFFKGVNSIIGPGDTIVLPEDAGRVDEEAELVVVMGRRCSKVSRDEAPAYIFGYTCGNDVSARVWQRGDKQWWRAKSSDTFTSIGPLIATDVNGGKLEIRARLNGQEVQRCFTSELLFDIPTIVSAISQVVTLQPGDVIFTGTSGRPAELHDGDVVEVEIEGIGTLRNSVRAER